MYDNAARLKKLECKNDLTGVFKPAVAWNNSQLKQRNDFDLMESIKIYSKAKPVKKC